MLRFYEKYFVESFLIFAAIAFFKAGYMFLKNISWDDEIKLRIVENRLGYIFGLIDCGHDFDAPF